MFLRLLYFMCERLKNLLCRSFGKVLFCFKPLHSISVDSIKLKFLAFWSLLHQAHGLVGERLDRPSRV